MKTRDEFEAFLAGQPWRPLPPEWRHAILDAANAQPADPKRRGGWVASLRLRHAWAALAAVWLGLALLHFDTPPAPVYAGPLPRPTAAEIERRFARRQAVTAALLAALDAKHQPGVTPPQRIPLRGASSPGVL